MNCDKALKLIRDKFAGGISPSDENLLGQHIESCPDCKEFYKREKAITDDLKSLDYNKYREESINAFGRLAGAVCVGVREIQVRKSDYNNQQQHCYPRGSHRLNMEILQPSRFGRPV